MNHELILRLGFFTGVLSVMAIWETLGPRRALTISWRRRWVANLALVAVNTFILRLLFPHAAVGVARFAEQMGWGLLHGFPVSEAMAVALTVIALDLVVYGQHVTFHAVPVLWNIHRVHHADLDFDVTTGLRFHPLEIVLSMVIKSAAILLLGAPALGVMVFEILLNTTSMFNHGNVRLPLRCDRLLRLLIVTPDMHRVHHSMEDRETNRNFGFSLSLWDRLFRTYRDQPNGGHEHMTIGIRNLRDPLIIASLTGMLGLPFRREMPDETGSPRGGKGL